MNDSSKKSLCKHINDCDFQEGNGYLIDTNIWIRTVCRPDTYTSGGTNDIYSRTLLTMMKQKCNIYTNTMVISEIANKYLRDEFNVSKDELNLEKNEYKLFRTTENYKKTAELVSIFIRRIAKFSKICNLERHDDDLLYDLADEFSSNKYDFNDMIFAEICKEKNLTLVTHDSDFVDYGIDVITANKEMLDSN